MPKQHAEFKVIESLYFKDGDHNYLIQHVVLERGGTMYVCYIECIDCEDRPYWRVIPSGERASENTVRTLLAAAIRQLHINEAAR